MPFSERLSTPFIFLTTFAISWLMIGCSTAPKAQDKERAQLYLQLGTSHLQQGNYPSALRALLDSERLDPTNSLTQNNLGIAYLVREKYELAESHFKRSLTLDPSYTDARNNLGRLYLDIGMYDKAIHELELASRDLTYDQPEKSWSNLGQAYFFAGQYARAKVAFHNSLKARPANCYTMNYYGRTLFELKEFKTSAESLDQAIRLCEKSKFEEPHFYSGMSLYKLGSVERARTRFEEMLQLYPNGMYAAKAKEMLELIK
jgi:Tfp pilus assembly protein PilF